MPAEAVITQAEYDYIKQENALLREELAFLKHRLFGVKRESLTNGQVDLFDQSTVFQTPAPSELEQAETASKPEKPDCHKKQKGKKAMVLAQYPQVPVHHELDGEARQCPHCATEMRDIGTTITSREPVRIPEHFEVHVHYQHAYECRQCSNQLDHSVIKKAAVPRPLIPNSFASPSILTQTMIEKYRKKVPVYRQEKDWEEAGFPLTRQQITNWHILACDYGLASLYELMHQTLLKQDVVHADETSYRVLESEKLKTYYWVFASGRAEDKQIFLYEHADSRGTEIPKHFLSGYTRYLQTDGYQVYEKLDQVTRVACLSHIRRKFFEAMGQQSTTKSKAKKGVDYCDRMFKLERNWKLLTPEQRYEKRQAKLKEELSKFFTWCETLHVLPQSKLGRAVDYALSQREAMENVLLDGRLELSNNRVERAVKELVIGRKNWLFSKSFKGARSSGIILSVIRSAEANGLDCRRYLEYLFTELPNLPIPGDSKALQDYLPWSPQVQASCSR
ncbi:IS66 family transposase [Lacticaseibacillus styriensis]|uniref:Transposase n=2 Tax=Lacticaseibacillus TaxID=2759736 RepID=A0AAN1C7T3_LACCA|nr:MULTISPECIES: IS66 family transposase [Lacticaseibacillus]ARY90906.1 transposase [Lacticaseibacillus casei]ARY91384.1 transposase [Lacticaseibacillus casei]WLV81517.1 IS66 family transposase [Lacticaseibacillus sp. NCIMB 15473]WLV81997.1 IS66 family transposase [Lacticaseibacillus sp. NCIMB 15473]